MLQCMERKGICSFTVNMNEGLKRGWFVYLHQNCMKVRILTLTFYNSSFFLLRFFLNIFFADSDHRKKS